MDLLIIGTLGSIVNTLGLVLLCKAFSVGPLGPVQALACIQSIMFSAVQALVLSKMPTSLELIGMFIGILGALVLTIPDQLKRLFFKS